MARKKYKTKGIGMPLFPDVRYVTDRKGAKITKRDKIIIESDENRDYRTTQEDEKKIVNVHAVAQQKETVKKFMLFVVVLVVLSIVLFTAS